ncbi:MAG: C-type lectin domain-containing protein, partial [Planctomycetota bacterium]|nr:C-type lectin domain-containing protein [Planctomycetota bacterium]
MQLTLGLFHPTGSARLYVRLTCATVLSLLGGVLSASAQTPAVQADWIQSPINGHWYGVDYTPRTWTDSEALAVSLGGHLATIRSQAEQDWIEVNLAPYMPGEGLLLGLNDAALEGTFVWASGESVPFTNWATGQPDNAGGDENYVHMFGASVPSVTWKWNDMDIMGTDIGSPLALIELPFKPQVGWSWPKVITNSADGARSVYAADLDGDGDADVLSASFYDDKIAWYENFGGGAFGPQQVISTAGANPSSVYTSDLDGDGDVDVLSTSHGDGKVAWYENLGSGVFGTQQVITISAAGAFSV